MSALRASGSILTVLVGLTLSSPAGAQQVDPVAFDALYSLDFDYAEQKFRDLTVQSPDNPTYWNLLASSLWLKVVYEQEKLNLESFAGARLGTSDSNDLVSEREEARLREVIDRAISTAESILIEEPRNLEALYALGASYGTLATFEATVKRGYLSAYRNAKKAREYHMQVLMLDRNFNDARLTIGAYDYTLGVIPPLLRYTLGLVLGMGGDKEEGIRQLEFAARLGRRASTNAKMILIVVYNRERQYERSLELIEDLHSLYPRNYLLEVTEAAVYQRMGDWDSAIEVYETILSKIATGTDGYDRQDPAPIRFRLGEANIHGLDPDDPTGNTRRLDRAVETLGRVVENDEATDGLKARSHLWLGKILDSRHERSQALVHYRAVLDLDVGEGLQREARRYQERPYEPE